MEALLDKTTLRAQIRRQVDEMFAADNWETFESILQSITGQLLALEYPKYLKEPTLEQIETYADSIRKHMTYKYKHGQDIRLKRTTKDTKEMFCLYANMSTLPGHWRD